MLTSPNPLPCRAVLPGLLVGLALLASTPDAAAEDQSRRTLLVLTSESSAARVDTSELWKAITAQFSPYPVDCQRRSWRIPDQPSEAVASARRLAEQEDAAAVAWYSQDSRDPAAPSLKVHLLDLQASRTRATTLNLGPPVAGIERTMAAAVRTLQRAGQIQTPPAEQQEQAKPVDTSAKSASSSGSAPPLDRPRLRLAAGYGFDLFVLGEHWGHGPSATLEARIVGRLHAGITLGYQRRGEGQAAAGNWSRQAVRLGMLSGLRWRLGRRWTLLGAVTARVDALLARADVPATGAEDSATVWEVGLGGHLGLGLHLVRRLWISASLEVLYLPLMHSLTVGSSQLTDPGRLAVSPALLLAIGLW